MRRAIGWLFLAMACGSPPTVSVQLVKGDGTPELTTLSRLRLIVRTCDDNQPALAQDLPLGGMLPPIGGAVVPGTSFYVWIQGWERCNPPCKSEDQALPLDCVCVPEGDPTAQIFKYEACTDWLEANADVRRTLTLAPKTDPPLCPPPPLAGDACKTP